MLGWIRLVLAIMVMTTHLSGVPYLSHLGGFAVIGFYVVSGFLMTMVLNETYGFDLRSFAINRALRIFPVYLLVATLTLAIIIIIPGAVLFHPIWEIKTRFVDLLGNTFLVPFEYYDMTFRLVPPAWSLGVELTCYFMLWLIVARSRRTASLVALAALVFHATSLSLGNGWQIRYFPSYAALLPFSLGSCVYFYKHLVGRENAQKILILAIVGWIANLVACGFDGGLGALRYDLHFYISLLLFTITILALQRSNDPLKLSGKMAGDLAYPVFLTHWLVGFVMASLLLKTRTRGIDLVVLTCVPVLTISYILVILTRRYVDPIRRHIRDEPSIKRRFAPGELHCPVNN